MSKSILIVDDSSTVLMSVDAMLSKLGFQVEKAKDGVEAETRLKGGLKVNLIITDINMPRMDGIELISKFVRLLHIALPQFSAHYRTRTSQTQ